jgi:hypothetical protein
MQQKSLKYDGFTIGAGAVLHACQTSGVWLSASAIQIRDGCLQAPYYRSQEEK